MQAFDYFRGIEAEQYNFYRIPKVMFTDNRFRVLSCEAKVLYGLILDRMGLSVKNHWLDEKDRVYIIYTVDEVMEMLNCSHPKAIKILAELDTDKGIGLIEKKRLGLGRPNVIYVKNFMTGVGEENTRDMDANQSADIVTSRSKKIELQEKGEYSIREDENPIFRSKGNELQEVEIMNGQKYEKQTSRSKKIELQEVKESDCNKTDINKTEFNENDKGGISPPILSDPVKARQGKNIDMMDAANIYRDIIRQNIFWDGFIAGRHADQVGELVELMVDVMLMPDDGVLRISGLEKPVGLIKSRLIKLDQRRMEYVLECLEKNTTKIGNIRAYLLTTLYNASLTMNCYYQAEVNHDMYGGCRMSTDDTICDQELAAALGT